MRRPRAAVAKEKNALRLVALNEQADAVGLRLGQALTDARAIQPDLVVEADDATSDAALLEAVADWCDRYTPLVALDPSDGLLLDVSGCAHLFGGEAALIADLESRLKAQGFALRAALADTPGAAWAMARYATSDQGPSFVVPSGCQRQHLALLPVAALRLDAAIVATLDRVGLKRVAQLLDQPRAPLAARFGMTLAQRLDQALGAADEPISPRLPVPELVAERRFAEPVSHADSLRAAIIELAGRLSELLASRGQGARALELALFRVDGVVARTVVGTSRPLVKPQRMAELFYEKLHRLGDELDAGFGFDLMRLAALETQDNAPRQVDFSGDMEMEAALDRLVDRLGARLGMNRVTRLISRDSHQPETAVLAVPAALVNATALAWQAEPADMPVDRPLRLFETPEPVDAVAEVPDGPPVRFRWRRALYEVARAEGPERLAASWWQGGGVSLSGSPHQLEPPRQEGREQQSDPSPSAATRQRSLPGRNERAIWSELATDRQDPQLTQAPPALVLVEGEPETDPPFRPEDLCAEARLKPAHSPVPTTPEGTIDGWLGRGRGLASGLSNSEPTPGALGVVGTGERAGSGRASAQESPASGSYGASHIQEPTPEASSPPTRDYFRIEDTSGRRFWLFREGLYGRETDQPGWFMHGLFG